MPRRGRDFLYVSKGFRSGERTRENGEMPSRRMSTSSPAAVTVMRRTTRLDDPGLFGRKQLRPERVEFMQGRDGVGLRDAFTLGQLVDGGEFAGFQHLLPAEGAGQGLDQGVVSPALNWRAVGQLHLLAPAAFDDAERDMQGDGVGVAVGFMPPLPCRRPSSRARGRGARPPAAGYARRTFKQSHLQLGREPIHLSTQRRLGSHVAFRYIVIIR